MWILGLTVRITLIIIWLVVWNMDFIFPFHIWHNPSQLTFIFFRGVGIPPTSSGTDVLNCMNNQSISDNVMMI